MKMDFTKFKEFENLANQKEKEWKKITSLQLSTLQTGLEQKEKELKQINSNFLKLKEDFKYNLKLLQDRDKELKQYDESFAKTKALESVHTAEISDLKIRIAKITDSLEREQQSQHEMQRHYRQRLIDQQAELEAFKSAKDTEVDECLSQLSQMKSQHERLESQLRSEIESQKFELTSELDIALQKKDREKLEKEEKIQAEAFAHQLKCKLLEKELELVKSAQDQQAETLNVADEVGSKLRKKLQEAEHDMRDISAIKNARILELEAKVQNLEIKNSSIVSEYDERRQQLDKDIRMKQANMDAVRQNFLEKEKILEENIRKLQTQMETSTHETRRALWDKNDLEKEKDIIIDKLRKEIQDLNFRFENQAKINGSTVVSRDVEIQNLRKREDLIKNESEKLKDDLEKYKRDLALATQKVNILLQSKVQLKMDWQQRCQEVEQKQYAKSEALILSLTKSRDMAVAEVRKLRRQLGLNEENVNEDVDNTPSIEHQMESLQQQNNQLKMIIEEMTADMQKLATGQRQATVDANKAFDSSSEINKSDTKVSTEYVKSLENELMTLKREKRLLEEKQTTVPVFQETEKPLTSVVAASFTHPDVKSHINSLNKTIGNLRSDKMDMSAQLQKVHVRLRHQDGLLSSRENDSKKKIGRIQELEYELSSQKRRNEQETVSLKRRISDLELQLAETRREADEYYRGGIQNNLRATELGNQLSQMTVDAATKTPWMGGVAQAGIVNQLQSELTELRKELTKAKQAIIFGKDGKPNKAAALNRQLHEKLRQAAEHISRLLNEKSQLLEVGNSLRSELVSIQQQIVTKDPVTKDMNTKIEGGDNKLVKNKLDQMEDLQYQLTKQELQYAQRTSPRKYQVSPDIETPPSTSTPNEVSHIGKLHETNSTVRGSSLKPLQYSLSSVGDASMKDVWKMLDHELSSPSVPGSKDTSVDVRQRIPSPTQRNQQIKTVHAKEVSRLGVQPRPKGKRTKTHKIRNYNIRDDNSVS